MIKLKTIKIKGFRSFGNDPQSIDLTEKANFIWAGNSQGKTSFTEALEFLLTGNISRRELLASSKDEFADALKNAFLQETDDVYVELVINRLGTLHKIKRLLKIDFGKRNDCSSELYVDNQKVTEEKLVELGFVFNVPPLSTPILMQHCLSYLLTANPQSRAEFFRAVFEVADIEKFRETVVLAIANTEKFESKHITTINLLAELEAFKDEFSKCLKFSGKKQSLEEIVKETIKRLLGENAKEEHEENLAAFSELHEKYQKIAFPISLFGRSKTQDWSLKSSPLVSTFKTLSQLQVGIDSKLKHFVTLYAEIESLSKAGRLPMPQNECPVCKTTGLTPDRLEEIKEFLKENKEYQTSLTEFGSLIKNCTQKINQVYEADLVPKFLSMTSSDRKERGFLTSALRSLVNDDLSVDRWLISLRDFIRTIKGLKKITSLLKQQFTDIDINNSETLDIETFQNRLLEYEAALTNAQDAEKNYQTKTQIIYDTIQEKVSEKTNTVGWKQLIELAESIVEAQNHLDQFHTHTSKQKAFNAALQDIDRAKSKILDAKFGELSCDIKKWWMHLRPEESSYFEHIKPRSASSRRNIDFKVGLTNGSPDSKPVLRDAVAVFSQSQISCLGLAAFLAKKINGENTFLVLDDPILSVDEDHRAHFIHVVIEELIKSGIQIVLLTQDQKTWSSLQNLYLSHLPSAFQFEMDNPADGTKIINRGDSAKAQLSAVKPLIRNKNLDIRKMAAERLRDAAERLCKEILVLEKTLEGNKVDITTYSGKTLEILHTLVNPYLKDPAHTGKLKVIRDTLNPGNHDDEIPNQGALSVVFGNLTNFEEFYIQKKT